MGKRTYLDLKTFKEKAPEIDEALKNESPLPPELSNIGLRKQFVIEEVKEVEGEEMTLDFVISTGSMDRDNDTIAVNGWKMDNYLKNPVVLWAHDYKGLPVGKSLWVTVQGGKLKSRCQFTPKEINPFGNTVYQMYKNGFLNAVSVGFAPQKWQYREDGTYGVDFIEQELLEYSCVPVPANPEALVEMRSAGIDPTPVKEWAEKALKDFHQDEGQWLSRNAIESIITQLSGKQASDAGSQSKDQAEENQQTEANAGIKDIDDQGQGENQPSDQDNKDIPQAQTKEGRVLSKANEDKLRKAVELMSEVLASVGQDDDPDDDDKGMNKPEVKTNDDNQISAKPNDTKTGDDTVLITLTNDKATDEGETKFSIDEQKLKEVVQEVKAELISGLRKLMGKVD